jgi:hypothetical protein
MRLVVETLLGSLPALASVCLFGGFVFGLWAILGVQVGPVRDGGSALRCASGGVARTSPPWHVS